MNSNSPVERVKPVGLTRLFFLLMMVGLLSVLAYLTFFPKAVFFNVQPAGSTVYVNGKLVCANTPCHASLNRVFPKHIIIDRAQHYPHTINLLAFGKGWDENLDGVIKLEFMVVESDKKKGLEDCQDERAREEDRNNVDAEPCYRVPPVMPWRATRSGHCHLVFDVNKTGKTKNIRLNGCTGRGFEAAAMQAVELWTYLPKIENGKAVERVGMENKVTFRLTGEAGRIISEPSYFIENVEHKHKYSVYPSFQK